MKKLLLLIFILVAISSSFFAQDMVATTDYHEYYPVSKTKKKPPVISREEYKASTNYAKEQLLNFAIKKIEYPEIFKDNCFEGTIIIDVRINQKGEIIKAEIIKSFDETLNPLVLQAFKELRKITLDQERYIGAKHLRLPITFSLR